MVMMVMMMMVMVMVMGDGDGDGDGDDGVDDVEAPILQLEIPSHRPLAWNPSSSMFAHVSLPPMPPATLSIIITRCQVSSRHRA